SGFFTKSGGGDRDPEPDGARWPVAEIREVAGGLHGRAPGADQRAGNRPARSAPVLRLVRNPDRRRGGRSAGLSRRVPREQQLVLPGEPVSGGAAGGDRDRRRGRRYGDRPV